MNRDETGQSDQAFFQSRGFGQRIGFGERPAVLVIDLMRAFADPANSLGASLDDVIARTNRVLDAAHAAAVPVGDRSANAHRQSLFDMAAKYGDVVDVDEVLRYLQRLHSG